MSEIRTNLLSDAAGTGPAGLFKQSAAKAWATLNNSGTFALLDSFGVSSATDTAVGRITYSFTSSFANADYSVSGSVQGAGNISIVLFGATTRTASSAETGAYDNTNALLDRVYNSIAAHGDLA